jgi:outer membrane protein
MVLPDGDLTYFLTDHWAVAAEAGILRMRIAAEKTLIGDLDIGHVWSMPVLATAQYHFLPEERLNPYLGAGVYASWFFGETPAGGLVTSLKVPPLYGTILVAGLDYQLGGRWYANAEIKQIFLAEQTYQNASGTGARVSMNVLIAGVGIGYKF